MKHRFYRGYVELDDKGSIDKFKDVPDEDLKTLREVRKLQGYGGVLTENTIVIDIDDQDDADLVMDIVEEQQLNCKVFQTTRGMHFVFKNTTYDGKNKTDAKSAIGIQVDIKCGHRNSYQVLKKDDKLREEIWDYFDDEETAEVPKWLLPVDSDIDFKDLWEGDGRNQTLFNYILTLQSHDYTKEEARETIDLINQYVLPEPLGKQELETVLRDDSFKKPVFFGKNNKFLFDRFATFLKNEHNILRINNQLHVYRDGIYIPGKQIIESKMIQHIPTLSQNQRNEVFNYLNILIFDNTESESSEWIAFENGLLNIFSRELIPYTPKHVITNKIPWNYNPNAHSELVDDTLNKMACHDDDVKSLMVEMVGYTMYRRNELGKAFILTGEKSNGKSTFLDMVQTMLGRENISSLDIRELGERFKTAELFGKLANIGDDISDEYIPDPSTFKKLVTGETTNVERKGQDPFDFSNYSKMLFSANNVPRLGRGRDAGAIMRRLIIVPFHANFSVNDEDFKPYIKYDLRQREAIEYLILLGLDGLDNVLKHNEFTHSEKAEKELQEYEIETNPILGFFELLPKEDVVNEINTDVYKQYREYALANDLQALGNVQFGKEVSRFYGLKTKVSRIEGKSYRIYVEE